MRLTIGQNCYIIMNSMTKYQLNLLISFKLDPEQINPYQEKIIEQIKKTGAEISGIPEVKEQTLAFSVKKEKKVWLMSFSFSIDPTKISEIKEIVEHDPNILRNLITQVSTPKRISRRKSRLMEHEAEKQIINKEKQITNKEESSLPESNLNDENLDERINEILNWD